MAKAKKNEAQVETPVVGNQTDAVETKLDENQPEVTAVVEESKIETVEETTVEEKTKEAILNSVEASTELKENKESKSENQEQVTAPKLKSKRFDDPNKRA